MLAFGFSNLKASHLRKVIDHLHFSLTDMDDSHDKKTENYKPD